MYRHIALLLSVLFAASACGKDPVTETEPDKEPHEYTLESYVKISTCSPWKEGDVFYAYNLSSGKQEGLTTAIISGIGSNSATVTLSSNLKGGERVVLCSSPCEDILSPCLPEIQDGGGTDVSYSISTVADLVAGGLTKFSVSPTMSRVRIVAECSGSSSFLGGKMKGASLSCEGTALSGNFTFDFEQGGIAPSSQALSRACVRSDETIAEGSNELSFYCFPADLSGRSCTVELTLADASGKEHTQIASIDGRDLQAGKTNSIRIIISDCLVTPSDKTRPEFTYTPVKYKREMAAGTFATASSILVDGMNWMDKLNGNTLDRFGGYDGVKPDAVTSSNPAGFWRTGKYKGHNVFVNPDGNVTILHGINGLIQDRARPQSQAESQVEYDKLFQTDAQWASWAAKMMADFGFNSTSTGPSRILNLESYYSVPVRETVCRSNPNNRVGLICNATVLRTFSWDYGTISKTGGPSTTGTDASVFTLMFDPDYLEWVDDYAKKFTAFFKGDRDFIGYYTDNELQFRWAGNSKPGIMLKEWIVLDQTAKLNARCYPYAQQYAKDFVTKNYGVEPIPANITAEMESAFLTNVAEYYYKTATEAIRKYDSEHLILGSRLHGAPQGLKEVTVQCAKYNDVLSTNIYHVWEPADDYYTGKLEAWIGDKPCIITEFYTRNEKQTFNGVAYSNSGEGGGWIVSSQEDRGRYYENFTRKAISFKNIAGWQWFQVFDDFLSGFGWNNKGVIAPDFQYYGLYPRMQRLHWNIYQILDYYCGATGNTPSADNINSAIWL